MSGKREVSNEGTNKAGNDYKAYNDGAYKYTNRDSSGQVTGRDFNPNDGHDFYKPANGNGGQAWHGNQNTGTRNSIPKK